MATIKFRTVFRDPDMVGSSEYLALHDLVRDVVCKGDEDGRMTLDQIDHAVGVLGELIEQCKECKRLLVGARSRLKRMSRGMKGGPEA